MHRIHNTHTGEGRVPRALEGASRPVLAKGRRPWGGEPILVDGRSAHLRASPQPTDDGSNSQSRLCSAHEVRRRPLLPLVRSFRVEMPSFRILGISASPSPRARGPRGFPPLSCRPGFSSRQPRPDPGELRYLRLSGEEAGQALGICSRVGRWALRTHESAPQAGNHRAVE